MIHFASFLGHHLPLLETNTGSFCLWLSSKLFTKGRYLLTLPFWTYKLLITFLFLEPIFDLFHFALHHPGDIYPSKLEGQPEIVHLLCTIWSFKWPINHHNDGQPWHAWKSSIWNFIQSRHLFLCLLASPPLWKWNWEQPTLQLSVFQQPVSCTRKNVSTTCIQLHTNLSTTCIQLCTNGAWLSFWTCFIKIAKHIVKTNCNHFHDFHDHQNYCYRRL